MDYKKLKDDFASMQKRLDLLKKSIALVKNDECPTLIFGEPGKKDELGDWALNELIGDDNFKSVLENAKGATTVFLMMELNTCLLQLNGMFFLYMDDLIEINKELPTFFDDLRKLLEEWKPYTG